jgi:hypothetical protein
MKTLYLLSVGINAYKATLALGNVAAFPALEGCKLDAEDLIAFFKKDNQLKVVELLLCDEKATKTGISDAILTHLGQAGPDDLALFYFSGHGTVEKADTHIWTASSSGRLEGIVCYCDDLNPGKVILADKELRYLFTQLYEKTQAHIVTIFDCCHAGDNLRAKAPGQSWVSKKIEPEFNTRDWSDFLFSNHYQPADFKNKGIDQVMPPGRYIQLAACESDETGKEAPIAGRKRAVFTYYLLKALEQCGLVVSYIDLINRVRNQIQASYSQTPVYDVPNQHTDMAQLGFLGRPVGELLRECRLDYTHKTGKYVIDRGYFHHVLKDVTLVSTQIGMVKYYGRVSSVGPNSAEVAFTLDALLALPKSSMPATLHHLGQRAIRLKTHQIGAALEQFDPVMQRLGQSDVASCIIWDEKPESAEYLLVMHAYGVYLSKIGDENRPLFKPILWDLPNALEVLAGYIRQMAQWHFSLQLTNMGKDLLVLPPSLIQIDVFQVIQGQEIPLPIGASGILPQMEKLDGSWQCTLRVRIKNTGNEKLQVAMLYFTRRFGCDPFVLLGPGKSVLIEAKEEKWLCAEDDGLLEFSLEEDLLSFNWPENVDYLKCVFATDPFDTNMFELTELPSATDITDIPSEESEFRGSSSGWNAFVIPIRMKNPAYQAALDRDLGAKTSKYPFKPV